jgi:hypothetical protein
MRTDTVYAEPYPQEVRAAIYCRLSDDIHAFLDFIMNL